MVEAEQASRQPSAVSDTFGGLRERLIALVLVVLCLPLTATALLLDKHARDRARAVELELVRTAQDIARDQAAMIQQIQGLLGSLARLPETWRSGSECQANFSAIASGASWMLAVGVAGPDGVVQCGSTAAMRGVTLADRPYFQRAMAHREIVLSDVLEARGGFDMPTLVVAHPIALMGEEISSLLIAAIRLDRLAELMEQGRVGHEADIAMMVDGRGALVAHQPVERDLSGRHYHESPLVQQMLTLREGVVRGEGLDGVRRVYGFTDLPGTGAIIAVARDEGALFGPSMREAAFAYGALLSSALVAAGLACWFGRAVLLRGLDGIAAAARTGTSLAAVPLDPRAATEIHDLHRVLREYEQRRLAQETRWRALGEAGAQVVWWARADGKIRKAPGWEALTGQIGERLQDGLFSQSVHSDDRERVLVEWEVGIDGGEVFAIEYRMAIPNRPDAGAAIQPGKERAWRWMRVEAVPVRDEEGELREWVGALLDVDARRQAEIGLQERETRLRSILETAADAVVVVDDRGLIRDANPAAIRTFGWSRTELLHQSVGLLMPDGFGAAHQSHVAAHAAGGRSRIIGMRRELEGVRRSGEVFPLEISVTQWRDADGRAWYTGIMRDVTERHRAAQALAESETRFRLLAENSGDVVALCTSDGTRSYVSPAAKAVLGWEPQDMIGRRGRDFVHPEDAGILAQAQVELLSGSGESTATYRHRRPDGSWVWVDGNARRQAAPEGRNTDYVVVLRDATARVAAEQKLRDALACMQEMAATDGLTNLANRRRFDELLTQSWERCARAGQSLSVLLVDADRFKLFNDHYGHLAGDDCLRAIADILSAVARRPDDLAARYGGEEFALLLPNTDAGGALHVAQRLRHAVEVQAIPHAGNAPSGVVTISIGSATMRFSGADTNLPDIAALLAAADAALYQAKNTGRNRVVLASTQQSMKALKSHDHVPE